MDKLLSGSSQTIRVEFRDSTHALVDATGAVPVSVVDGGGAAIVSANANHDSIGKYSLTLTPAQLANLDQYTATWTPTINGVVNTRKTYFEVVGDYIFTISDARLDPGLADVTITDAQIASTRSLVEDRFERWCGVSFVPRGARWTADGDYWNAAEILLTNPDSGQPVMKLRRVVSIVQNTTNSTPGTAVDLTAADVIVYPSPAKIWRRTGFFDYGFQNLVVLFEHGYSVTPEPIRQAGIDYARALLIPTNEDERQVNLASELDTRGAPMMDLRSRWRPTGIPKIDAVLWDYNLRVPGIA